jgi:hypothetical protein
MTLNVTYYGADVILYFIEVVMGVVDLILDDTV